MNTLKLFIVLIGLTVPVAGYAQAQSGMSPRPSNPRLIAVVNRANWCGVCRANGPRFGALLLPYAAQGVAIYTNDLTNPTTKAASETELQQAGVYEAVTTIPRKGMGKMLKACGLLHDKKQLTDVSGIVTFIDPKTHKQLKQLSIASPDAEMKATIDNLLKQAI